MYFSPQFDFVFLETLIEFKLDCFHNEETAAVYRMNPDGQTSKSDTTIPF